MKVIVKALRHYIMNSFQSNEKYLSQIPALQLLIALGYEYISPEDALPLRGGKITNVLLETVLREQLEKLNRISYKGEEYLFSEANIQEAIRRLKHVQYDGLAKTNETVYDLITVGTSLEQSVEGISRSSSLKYIDWENPDNNVFHVAPEYSVQSSDSITTARPDIVLFVNGIPFCVIECKAPNKEVEEGISQSIRNQGNGYIPKLFIYAQLLMATNKNEARYATVGSKERFWSVWKEPEKELEKENEQVRHLINTPLSDNQKAALFSAEFASAREHFDALEQEDRQVTAQDRAIYSLCRPQRLLDLTWRFTMFESGIRKVARHQQYFVVRSALSRIKQRDADGRRKGGIVWHSQGSGKSLTMAMLARNLTLDKDITNPRIILVTDRKDLNQQLGKTFETCDLKRENATSGRNLVKHIKDKVGIITTLVHKFDKALKAGKSVDDSADIFVLVDESHRTQFGTLAAEMRALLPNACYIGFTGTPLLKSEKNSFVKFGGLIEPHYSIQQAVEDKAVLPLLYEGRLVEMEQEQAAIDLWFERHTSDLNKSQQADLKRKYARAKVLNEANRVIYMRAFDISNHYRETWQGTGLKAQLVAPSKAAAIKYHEYLKGFGYVSSEVVISPPDTREGHKEVNAGPTDEVGKFWDKMMKNHGTESRYTEQIIQRFKEQDEPEILIVVDKLLTGFDAPRNAVLYLCRNLTGHTLLQAIARVNRLYDNKDAGYIVDYVGTLENLEKSLTMYEALQGFDEKDLADVLISINKAVEKLPQRHSDLWAIFRKVENKGDEEAFEVLLGDKKRRDDFYERLTAYGKTLHTALATDRFLTETDEATLKKYKDDLKRFGNLKSSVQLRYDEVIDYRDYDPKIKKLLDTHIQANEVIQINEPVDIFDKKSIMAIRDGDGVYVAKSAASKADTIAHATKRVIKEKMDEDPAFYKKFSILIEQAIENFKIERLIDSEYLDTVSDICDAVSGKRHDNVPDSIRDNDEACAYYGTIHPYFAECTGQALADAAGAADTSQAAAQTALAVQKILQRHWIVDFLVNHDKQKQVQNDIDDFLCDEIAPKFGISLSSDRVKAIIDEIMQIARSRRGSG